MELFGNRYESMYLKTPSQMTGNISQAFGRLSKEKEMAGLKAALKVVDDMMSNPIFKSTFAMKHAISEIIVTRQSLLQKDYAEGVSKGNVYRLFNLMTALIGGDIGSVSDPNYAVAALKYFYQYRDNEAVKTAIRQFSEIAKGDENHGLIICSLVVDFILNEEPVDMERYKGDGYDYCYALMHFVKGDDQEARKYAEKSTYAEASWILGQLSLKRKDYLSAIDYFQQAIGRGLPAAWINLVEVYLTKGEKTDIVIQALEGACRHERYLGFHTSAPWELLLDEIREFGAIETEEEQVARVLKELEVFDPEPKQETRKTGGSQKSKKGRGKRKGDETSLLQESQKSEVQPTVYGAGIAEVEAVEHQYKELRKSQLRLYKCQITKNINLRNYQEAIRLVIESCTMTENIIQRVSLGESALWIIRAMVNDKIYRDLDTNALTTVQDFSKENWLTSSLKSDVGKKFNDSAIKICHFLDRDDAVLDPVVLRPMMNKVGCLFLGYLHNNNPDEWQDNPMEMIRMLKESGFEPGAELAFTTGSHLSFQGHLHEDMDEIFKSEAFYQAANNFNKWRLVIKEKGRLPARISHKTPMGKMKHKPVK
ncbi:hypothetical protein ElyMa_004066300 [Elysia marginata]|uniref:Pentacotripeptide-repeat region of PRORP domain-containing protein n=1 Tax=Elysia marginata TaxID=1093978 RepID=A0AAV4G8B3_9GAST|nr:hypothetical protein ElyMa_004066300 [Elysia marginata]